MIVYKGTKHINILPFGKAWLGYILPFGKAWLGFLLGLLLLLSSCSSGDHKTDVIVQTAKLYYEDLIQGKFTEFVEGTAGCDSTMDAAYKEQMIINAQMFAEQMKADHKGLASVDTSRCVLSKDGKTADAFLVLHFADSTKETIIVPMVSKDDVWYMK